MAHYSRVIKIIFKIVSVGDPKCPLWKPDSSPMASFAEDSLLIVFAFINHSNRRFPSQKAIHRYCCQIRRKCWVLKESPQQGIS